MKLIEVPKNKEVFPKKKKTTVEGDTVKGDGKASPGM